MHNVELVAKRLAIGVLKVAVKDYICNTKAMKREAKSIVFGGLKRVKDKRKIMVLKKAIREMEKFKKEVVQWFKDKSREPFGYYWCLAHAELSASVVNAKLKEIDNNLKI